MTSLSRAQRLQLAATIVRKPREAPDSVHWQPYADYLSKTLPRGYSADYPHVQLIAQHLDELRASIRKRGGNRYLYVGMPPRHFKSETITIRWPVHLLEHDPSLRICVGAYAQDFADRFGRKTRRLAKQRGIELMGDRTAAREWETTAGGVYRSTGVGAPPTGEGFDVIIVDDPIRSRKQAESRAYRQQCRDWWTDDLESRAEPGCVFLIVMTRWHREDLAGYVLGNDDFNDWRALRLPAVAEKYDPDKPLTLENQPDPIGRKPGQALCPDRYNVEDLARIEGKRGAYSWNSLYQQRPTVRGGKLFKISNLKYLRTAPLEFDALIRYWDLAATEYDDEENEAAATAGALIGRIGSGDKARFVLLDLVWGQYDPEERDRVIKETAELDGREVPIYLEQEPGSGGKAQAHAIIRQLAGYNAEADRPDTNKEVRADPVAAQVNIGNFSLVVGPWNTRVEDEMGDFPYGSRKDVIDAISGGFSKIAEDDDLEAF